MNLHCSLDYIQFDANFTLNTATLCMLQYLLFLNLSILLQTFYRVYNRTTFDSIDVFKSLSPTSKSFHGITFCHLSYGASKAFLFDLCQNVDKGESFRRVFSWLKWMRFVPENLERLSSAHVRGYVAKLGYLNTADNNLFSSYFHLFSIFFKFSVKGFESNFVLEGQDSKSNYVPSSFLLDDESVRSYVLLCIIFKPIN